MRIELEVSDDNEGTESPWWFLVDPSYMKGIIEGAAEHGDIPDDERILSAIAFSIEGPFFSRKEGEDYLKSRHYDYSKSAGVWCGSGYRSHQYKMACRNARAVSLAALKAVSLPPREQRGER